MIYLSTTYKNVLPFKIIILMWISILCGLELAMQLTLSVVFLFL